MDAGDNRLLSLVCGVDAERGSLWNDGGPWESGCNEDDGRCVTK